MHANPEHPNLSSFVRARLRELKWTQTKLSEASGVSEGSISNLLNQKSVPETSTVERIADALGISRQVLLGFLTQEYQGTVSDPDIDPSAMYIARRLTRLPDYLRDTAIDAVSGVLDSFIKMAEVRESETNSKPIDLTIFPEQDREIISHLSPDFQWFLAALLNEGEDEYLKAMTYAKTHTDAEIRRQSASS
jgi:transcriptional regulator with XRE-family HTH domain